MESLNTAASSAPVESSPRSTHVVDRLLSAMERGDVGAVCARVCTR